MHKVKKANIIIETNKPISWVKSTIYDGLNKQPDLLGKINPKCVLSYIYPAQIGLFLTQCFLEYAEFISLLCFAKLKQTAESCILFFVLFYKKCSELNNKMRLIGDLFFLSLSLALSKKRVFYTRIAYFNHAANLLTYFNKLLKINK